ncbi:hypothetical protein AWM70_17940 [Paenibacillus yonginensis]|uniref:Uncharacterized protein n=1 Tax=Paenibacillus yonginensis TaxID=1462996 RepID=A0A1B1N471_9BACL|nr:hypothetical protein AWM70_17940 [Paenibacillus yonginensis]
MQDTDQREGSPAESPSGSRMDLPPCSCVFETAEHSGSKGRREFPLQKFKDSPKSGGLNLGGTTSMLVPCGQHALFYFYTKIAEIKDKNPCRIPIRERGHRLKAPSAVVWIYRLVAAFLKLQNLPRE